jgi:hypothetical protein
MATITGTNGNDVLTGIAGDDIVNALAGNDRIIPLATSRSEIDGGAGYDTIDNSGFKGRTDIRYSVDDFNYQNFGNAEIVLVDKISDNNTLGGTDRTRNIEAVIGSTTSKDNTINVNDFFSTNDRVDINLSKNLLKYSSASSGTKNLTVKNFNNVTIDVFSGSIRVKGNDLDNTILITNISTSTSIGSKGNDIVRSNVVDYSDIGRGVNFVLSGSITSGGVNRSADHSVTVNKNGFGIDTVAPILNKNGRGIDRTASQTIIGEKNKANLLDASTFSSTDRIDVNLANNSLKAITVSDFTIVPSQATQDFTIVNFVDVIGSKYNDKIVGANKNGKLTGGGGNDSITGGNKNDIITGSDSTARGVGEVDTLTGGGGRDKFVLGDKNGAYYVGKGANDYALITDFDLTQDSISIGSLKNYSFALEGKDTIDLYSGKDINTRDLIAKIQIAGGISTVSSNTKSALSPDASLNAFVGKINIISD